jgi:hypothetical protein
VSVTGIMLTLWGVWGQDVAASGGHGDARKGLEGRGAAAQAAEPPQSPVFGAAENAPKLCFVRRSIIVVCEAKPSANYPDQTSITEQGLPQLSSPALIPKPGVCTGANSASHPYRLA